MKKYISLAAVAAAALALGVSGAYATPNPATGTLSVTASLPKSCAVAASALNFGDIEGVITADKPGTGAISVTCTKDTSYSIDFTSGSGTQRTLSGAGGTHPVLPYNLWQDATFNTLWGTDLTGGTAKSGLVGTGSAQSIPVYGKIPANADATPDDNYTDAVAISVAY